MTDKAVPQSQQSHLDRVSTARVAGGSMIGM
jgi:hypothetical protein